MAWDGYFLLAGNELLNASRTSAYCRSTPSIKPYGCDDFSLATGDEGYDSPLADEAPWFDPDDPASWRFLGLLPISVTGLEDDSQTTRFVDVVGGGSLPVSRRRGAQEIVFTAFAIAKDLDAMSSGLSWLRTVLAGSCDGCDGDILCYLTDCPEIDLESDDPQACLDPYMRQRRRVAVSVPLTVVSETELGTDGTVGCTVTWTLTAGVPYVFLPELVVKENIIAAGEAGDPDVQLSVLAFVDQPCGGNGNIAVGLAQAQYEEAKQTLIQARNEWGRDTTDERLTTAYIQAGYAVEAARTDLAAAIQYSSILVDPRMKPPPPPPIAPLPIPAQQMPTIWDRRSLRIPDSAIPSWGESMPIVTLRSGVNDLRFVRVRFYPDPVGLFHTAGLDPCGACGEFIITYMPKQTELVIDSADQTANLVIAGGTVIDARRNVISTLSESWPSLMCGIAYIMVIDVAGGSALPNDISLSLAARI